MKMKTKQNEAGIAILVPDKIDFKTKAITGNKEPRNPNKSKTLNWKHICTPMFIAALFTVTKTWKQPKRPAVDERIKSGAYIR